MTHGTLMILNTLMMHTVMALVTCCHTMVLSAVEFAGWLEENFEVDVDSDIVKHVFDNRPMTNAQLSVLNPDASIQTLRKAVAETGYPVK